MAMKGRFFLAFLFLILTQVIDAEQLKGKKLKPEVGREDCEYYHLGKTVNGVWTGALDERCRLDSQNRTIKEPSRSHQTDWAPGLYDPCCTEYIGLVCRLDGRPRDDGYCHKPDPWFRNRKMSKTPFLKMMKKKKMDDGQELDDRWQRVENSPPHANNMYY